MCAIVDANVRDQVFGNATSPGGEYFRRWLTTGNGRLVVGGKLRSELGDSANFKQWFKEALLSGRAMDIKDEIVDSATSGILGEGICESNDPHIIALARISHARLLFTNDKALTRDFKGIIDQGVIFTTKNASNASKVTKTHRSLLNPRQQLCNC